MLNRKKRGKGEGEKPKTSAISSKAQEEIAAEHLAREKQEKFRLSVIELRRKLDRVIEQLEKILKDHTYFNDEQTIDEHRILLSKISNTKVTNYEDEEKRLTDILTRHKKWEAIVLQPNPTISFNEKNPQWLLPDFTLSTAFINFSEDKQPKFFNEVDARIAYWKKMIARMPDIEEKIVVQQKFQKVESEWAKANEKGIKSSDLVSIQFSLCNVFQYEMDNKYKGLFMLIDIAEKRAQLMLNANKCLEKWKEKANKATDPAIKNAITVQITELEKSINKGIGHENQIEKAIQAFNTHYMSRIASRIDRGIPEPTQKAKDLSRMIGDHIKKIEKEIMDYDKVNPKDHKFKFHQVTALKATQSYLENELDKDGLATVLKECNQFDKTSSIFSQSKVKSQIGRACAIKGDNLSEMLGKKQKPNESPALRGSNRKL